MSQQQGLSEEKPVGGRQSEDNTERPQAPAPSDPAKLIAGELEMPCASVEGTFSPEVPRSLGKDIPAPRMPLPPVEPPCQKGSPFSIDRARIAGIPVRDRQTIVDHARTHIDKRRTELRHEAEVRQKGPQGEARSVVLTENVQMVRLNMILDDPEFKNFRLDLDEEKLRELAESMKLEGLKVPITVIQAPGDKPSFFVRAGFRRVVAARGLGWSEIPAIVLPKDTPLVEEHWTNIIENSARHGFSTYEIANAAKSMRETFGIKAREFATRAGYSEPHVSKLLHCIDVLPDEILDEWRAKAPLPLDRLAHWATLPKDEALTQFHLHCGRTTKLPRELTLTPRKRIRNSPLMTATNYGLKRMGRLRVAFEAAPDLDEKTRAICLQTVDFCMGGREAVIGIHDPTTRQGRNKPRRQDELETLEPSDLGNIDEPIPLKTEEK